MKKTLIAAALVLGATTAAFAEDSSSSFSHNIYPQAGLTQTYQGGPTQQFQSRNVALTGSQDVVTSAQTFDRAGNAYAGGGF
jgi:uncharacterized protein YdeI (BOF family)